MTYKFCFLTANEAMDGTKIGYKYAKSKESEWVDAGNDFNGIITVGMVKGSDFIIHNDKAYAMMKNFYDVDNKCVLVVCTEVSTGCETKTF